MSNADGPRYSKFEWERLTRADHARRAQRGIIPDNPGPKDACLDTTEQQKMALRLSTFVFENGGVHREFAVNFFDRQGKPIAADAALTGDDLLAPLGLKVRDLLGVEQDGIRITVSDCQSRRGTRGRSAENLLLTCTPEAFMKLSAAWGYDAMKKLPHEQFAKQWETIKRNAQGAGTAPSLS